MNEIDERTEALLRDGWASPPPEFRDTVMQNIAAFEREKLHAEQFERVPVVLQAVPWWQWIALTAGSVIGVGQVMRFIFSVWFVTAAG